MYTYADRMRAVEHSRRQPPATTSHRVRRPPAQADDRGTKRSRGRPQRTGPWCRHRPATSRSDRAHGGRSTRRTCHSTRTWPRRLPKRGASVLHRGAATPADRSRHRRGQRRVRDRRLGVERSAVRGGMGRTDRRGVPRAEPNGASETRARRRVPVHAPAGRDHTVSEAVTGGGGHSPHTHWHRSTDRRPTSRTGPRARGLPLRHRRRTWRGRTRGRVGTRR